MKPGGGKRWMGLAALLASGVVLAAVSPLLISVSVDNTGLLSVSTDRLPKGWFSSKNAFDRTKSNVVTAYSLGATACSPAKPGGTLNSTVDGSFTPENNSQGATIAYFYGVSKDLSASQNHWYSHQHCDSTVEVHGCAEEIPVTVTATAYDKAGACHTYTDDSGVTRCAADTQVANLGAVEDPPVVDTDCGEEEASCGIGQCVSACEQLANAEYERAAGAAAAQDAACPSGRDGVACKLAAQAAAKVAHDAYLAAKQACPCNCKAQLPASCPDHNECADD